jgi:hypothetical protein
MLATPPQKPAVHPPGAPPKKKPIQIFFDNEMSDLEI